MFFFIDITFNEKEIIDYLLSQSIEELHLSNQLDNADVCELGIRPVPEWKVFKFTQHPGVSHIIKGSYFHIQNI